MFEQGVHQGVIFSYWDNEYLVISQDCDISYSGVDDTIIECIKLSNADPAASTKEGRNARVWQFDFQGSLHTAYAQDCCLFKKEEISAVLGDEFVLRGQLNPQLVNILKSWRASRYLRFAWPDEFIKRVGKGKGKIEQQLVKGAPEIHSLILKLNDYSDLKEDQEYSVDIALIFIDPPISLDIKKSVPSILRALRIISRFHCAQGVCINDFIETVRILFDEYRHAFPTERPDINDFLNKTESLIKATEKLLKAKPHSIFVQEMAIYMIGRKNITLEDYESYRPFTEDWMSYKGSM